MLIASLLILTNGLLLLNITLLTQMIQSSILFVNLGTSMNEGDDVDDGAGGSFELAIPTSRAVTVRDEDEVLIHPYVSKREENKDVPRGPNLSLSKADNGDDGVSYKPVKKVLAAEMKPGQRLITLNLGRTTAKFVKVIAEPEVFRIR